MAPLQDTGPGLANHATYFSCMSPRNGSLRRDDRTGRCNDIFSLGIMLYKMLTGSGCSTRS